MLEEYEIATSSIVFPFEGDPEVLRVGLSTALSNAIGVTVVNQSASLAKVEKERLTKTVTDAEKTVEKWNETKFEMSLQSPSGKLCVSLSKVVSPARWQELLSLLGGKNLEEVIHALSDRQQIINLLDKLNVQELTGLEHKLYKEKNKALNNLAVTKDALFNSILTAIALLRNFDEEIYVTKDTTLLLNKVNRLKWKVECGEFDVFLAHNAQDKTEVLHLGQHLRNEGIYPWIDVEQIPPGQWFQDVLQSALRKVKAAAIVIGTSGIGKWQAVELRAFLSSCVENNLPLIPVLLPGVNKVPDELSFLRELNLVQFIKKLDEEDAISKLVWGITGEKQQ